MLDDPGKFFLGNPPKKRKGAEMPKTQSRVPNYKLDQLLKDRVPFTNYNQTIVATQRDNIFKVTHWGTTLVEYDTDVNRVRFIDLTTHSQTTSVLQGRIVRNLLTRGNVDDLFDFYRNSPDYKDQAKKLVRLSRMNQRGY